MFRRKNMTRQLPRGFLAFCLLSLTALLAASCSSDSDSANSDNNITDSSPVFADNAAIAVNAGELHSCALRQSGTISCWGKNTYGQLGNGTQTDSSVPDQVMSIADATATTTGSGHSCALHQTGTISCWGKNTYGQLGNGTQTDSSVPVQVADIADATAITANWGHSCALHESGAISCWGNNYYGQLGNGQRGYDLVSSVPMQVADITDATAITTGSWHSCALHESGAISCWGNNYYGQLGNGQRGYDLVSSVPMQVADITNATAIAANRRHACALHETGTISCWGRNENGQLGNGTNTSSSAPVQVAGITDATAITAGYEHSCALHQDGTISCWGHNENGQLGNGTQTDSSVPVRVVGITDATAITTGYEHSCALHQDGTISCWGRNTYGQLGSGTDTWFSLVQEQVTGITDATAITTNRVHSCALREGGTISCWGRNWEGQLGNGQRDYDLVSSAPVQVVVITDATDVSAGSSHSCALREGGTISCWGENKHGQLGNQRGYHFVSSAPVQVADITDATAISAGNQHSCALHQTGTISCWGSNTYGQLGNKTYTESSSAPVQVESITDATAVSAGFRHSCALHQTGTISCWGSNGRGRLGNRTDTDSSAPVQVVGITDATAVTTGGSHSCALHQDSRISCWGRNGSGQLGNGADDDSSTPVQVADITDATAITAGYEHSCALREGGTISCWGYNRYGRLGNGTDTDSQVPVEVVGITDAIAITTGDEHSCALHQDGTMSCWGDNYSGQLGNGRWLPQFVVGFGS